MLSKEDKKKIFMESLEMSNWLDSLEFTYERVIYDSDKLSSQIIIFFDNNYGASLIFGKYTYGFDEGLWELAVIVKKQYKIPPYSICYDTEIADDVLGRLSREEVIETLDKISKLPTRTVD